MAAKAKARVRLKPKTLKKSKLEIFDVPLDDIVLSPDNPNEQDEETFDRLVEGIKEDGFNEPVHIVPVTSGEHKGKYMMASGEHRFKAAKMLDMKEIPAVIMEGWDDDKRKMELVAKNMLHGNINPMKFTKLVDNLTKKGYDKSIIQHQMGITNTKAFEKLYQSVRKNLNTSQKKKLDEAKERITSIEDFSSIIHTLFRDHGSDWDNNHFIVMTDGRKKQHILKVDKETSVKLTKMEERCVDKGKKMSEIIGDLIKNYNVNIIQ